MRVGHLALLTMRFGIRSPCDPGRPSYNGGGRSAHEIRVQGSGSASPVVYSIPINAYESRQRSAAAFQWVVHRMGGLSAADFERLSMNDTVPKSLRPIRDFAVAEDEAELSHLIYYRMAGKKRKAHGSWYRGETTNFHPMRDSLAEPDAVSKYVGHGWFPAEPFIRKDHYIAAFGSCFAAEVTRFLLRRGYRVFGNDIGLNVHIIRSGEGLVNTAALRQQFEWAFAGKAPSAAVWHNRDGSEVEVSPEIQEATRSIFLSTEVFIFTLGLSEVWYDKVSGDVFWRAIPNQRFDPDRHSFRVMGVDENRANLTRVYEMIREFRPEARIIFTLSPVPLAATFRPISCITANSVSKASLRVAIDEVMRAFSHDPLLHYFPSYEIITSFLSEPMGADLRHPLPETIEFVMGTFERHFLCG